MATSLPRRNTDEQDVSLLNAVDWVVPVQAPPIPGDGPLVYTNGWDDLVIVARLAPGEALASIWSWRIGDADWVRNYAC